MPELDIALNWCWNEIPAAEPAAANPAQPALHPLATATPQAKFSELLNVIYDTLLKHHDAYRAVQHAVRVWRDGPEAWPNAA